MEEIWKDIPGFVGYQISDLGRVRSCRVKGCTGICNYNKWHFVSTKWEDKDNYRYVKVRCNTLEGKRISMYLHRVLYSVFVGEIPVGMLVDHKDGNSLNNSLDNLRLATKKQNCINSKPRRGRKIKGVYLVGKVTKRWSVCVRKDGAQVTIGRFDTELEAMEVYNKAIIDIHGEFAVLQTLEEKDLN